MATLEELENVLVQAGQAGDEEAVTRISDAMKVHPTFQANAKENLESQAYRYDENFNELDKDSQRKNMSTQIARSMGLNDDEVDVTQGMGTYGRFKLSFQPTEQDKVKHLEDTYGRENIRAIDIGGKTKLLYRDEQETGGQFRAVDEEGTSLADFFGDTAGSVAPIAGAVGAAVATGGASIPLMAGAAALGTFAASAGQDVAVRAGSDEDLQLGEIAKRRGLEAAIGVPIDLATAGVGKFFSRRLASSGAKQMIGEVDKAVSRVDSQLDSLGKGALPKVEALRTGAGSKQASEIAAARPTSKLAKELQDVRDRLGEYKEMVSGRGRTGASTDDFNRVADELGQSYRKLVDDVGQVDKQLAKELEDQASRKMRSLSAPKVSESEVGTRVQEILKRSEGKAGEINDANWAALDEAAAASGARVPAWRLARSIREAVAEMEPKKNPALLALADEIAEKRGAGLNFSTVRDYLSRIDDSVPSSTEAGFKTAQQVAIAARKSVEDMRGELAERSGIKQQFQDTVDYYLNDYLNFKRQSVGSALKESKGAMAQPELAAKGLISNRSSIKAALRAARQGGPEEEAALRSELQDLYLNRMGLIGDVDPKTMNLQVNDDVVEELWGASKVKEFKNLQKRLVQSKVDSAELTKENLDEYMSALTGDERKRIADQIIKRGRLAGKLKTQRNAALLKKLQPKYDKQTRTWLDPEFTGMDMAKFSDGFVGATPTQVQRAMKLLEAQGDEVGMQAFRQSYIGSLLDSYKVGAQVDRFGNPLWNPKKLAEDIAKEGTVFQNMKAVLGKDGMDDILAANRVLLEASETTGKQVQEIFQPRYSLTSGGIQFYGVGNIIGGLRGKALAWAYGSKQGSKLMRFLTNEADDKATEAMLKKLLPALMTSSGGIKAAAIQGQFDPEFTEQVAPLFNAGQEGVE